MTEAKLPPTRTPRWVLGLAACCALFSVLPNLVGTLLAPEGTVFLGYPYATDDHMVYAAWMKQAQEGRFLLDNRFTTDAQPGLTVHLLFWALGLLSNLFGIVGTTAMAKAGFSFLFVVLAFKLVARVTEDAFAQKASLGLACFGGGIGYLVWHQWGEAIVKPSALAGLFQGRLPVDVWQPEIAMAPSMLTNALFMASMCLILGVILAVLNAQHSWKSVPLGAALTLLLMNVHSYDVLLLVGVAIGFILLMALAKQMTGAWLMRGAAIFAGALPSALWFVHVLRNDAVFQSRAATETFSPHIHQTLFGLLPLIVLACFSGSTKRFAWPLAAFSGGMLVLGYAIAPSQGYWLSPVLFGVVFVAGLGLLTQLKPRNPAEAWMAAWAMLGLALPFFPALFQRKLAMGLAVPWAILAGIGLAALLAQQEASKRRLFVGAAALFACASAPLWLLREIGFIQNNVSRTTVHQLFLSPDEQAIIAKLASERPTVPRVVALPGVPSAAVDAQGNPLPDQFVAPLITDLNPILSGLAGAYTFAGHWSETPFYSAEQNGMPPRRNQASLLYTPRMDDAQRLAWLEQNGITHLVAPTPGALPAELGIPDLRSLGEVEFEGKQWTLIRVR